MTPQDEIKNARDAQRLLDDPIFQKAFQHIESTLIERMKTVEISNVETQHELILSLQLLGSLKTQFKTAIDSGKMAEMTLAQSLAKKVRNFTR